MKSEFIYLDWNVIKALKENRAPQSFVNAITSLKSQYHIPFSFAHLCDRHKKFGPENIEFVKEDLNFFNSLSDGYMLGRYRDDYDIAMQDIYQKFDEVTEAQHTQYPHFNIPDSVLGEIVRLGMKEFFSNNQNLIWFTPIMLTALNRFDCDPRLYKVYRDIFVIEPPTELSFFADLRKKDIKPEKLRSITDAFLIFNESPPDGTCSKLRTAYLLLDICPEYQESKINQKNNFTNIYTDGEHTVNASFAKYYITEDHSVRKKARFVYLAYDIKTQVFSIDEFAQVFQR